jgi:CHAT domain-containing protein
VALSVLNLEHFEMSIAPTLSALAPSPGQGRRPWTLGAVINPTLDLPFTVIEAARSIQAFAAERCAVVSAAESTLAATRNALEGKTHWLLSTHSTFEPNDPRQSRIELAKGQALTLDALLSTDRAAAPRLVILSACKTGLQDLRSAPDEFVGFPTAFLQLGAGG